MYRSNGLIWELEVVKGGQKILTSPVATRIGFGSWQRSRLLLGFLMTSRTISQKGFPDVSPVKEKKWQLIYLNNIQIQNRKIKHLLRLALLKAKFPRTICCSCSKTEPHGWFTCLYLEPNFKLNCQFTFVLKTRRPSNPYAFGCKLSRIGRSTVLQKTLTPPNTAEG